MLSCSCGTADLLQFGFQEVVTVVKSSDVYFYGGICFIYELLHSIKQEKYYIQYLLYHDTQFQKKIIFSNKYQKTYPKCGWFSEVQ